MTISYIMLKYQFFLLIFVFECINIYYDMKDIRYMSKPIICLNLIEKNEAHIIEETLESIYKYVDYYVISDTGSTDNTKEVIKNFFDKKGIEGKIYDDPWQNHFGINRTLALKRCNSNDIPIKIDYIWVIDADDIIVGDLKLPNVMNADAYSLRYGDAFTYHRTQIFKNDPNLNWRYECVRHEYPTCDKDNANIVYIDGDYYVDSRRKGDRSKDPNKYLNDALAFEEWIKLEPQHKQRYMFYMAQSYFDHRDIETAIDRYQKRIDMGGWYEETFYSYLKIAEGLQRLNKPWEEVEKAYLKAYNFCKLRSEPLYHIANHYATTGNKEDYPIAYKYAKACASIPFPKECKLFIFRSIYDYEAPELLARMAYYIGEYAESYYTYKKLLNAPNSTVPEYFKNMVKKNIIFPINHLKNSMNCCLLYTGHKIVPYNKEIKNLITKITEYHTLYIVGDNLDNRYCKLGNIIYIHEEIFDKKLDINFEKIIILDDLSYYTSKLGNKINKNNNISVIHINTTNSFKIHPSTKYTLTVDNKDILCNYMRNVNNIVFLKTDEYEYQDFIDRYKLTNVTDITNNYDNLFCTKSIAIKINNTEKCYNEYNGMYLHIPKYIKDVLKMQNISDFDKEIAKNYFNRYKSLLKDNPTPSHYLAMFYEKLHMYEQARRCIEDALKLIKKNTFYDTYESILNVEKGKYLHYEGHYQKSYNCCNKAIKSNKLPPMLYQYSEDWRDRNISHIKDKTLRYPDKQVADIMKYQKNKTGENIDYPIVFSMTTCKRYDLFEKTINSFLNCCEDYLKINRWIVVDDNSSKKDRIEMKRRYPFFKFILKDENEKGHYKSMNIIHDFIVSHNTQYLLHCEDDFHYVEKRPYISDAIEIFKHEKDKLGQVLFNKNYAEVELWRRPIPGGFKKKTLNNIRYRIHEHYETDSWQYKAFNEKYNNKPSNCYWPHFSFRPSLLKCDMLKDIGVFSNTPHFEMAYAYEYKYKGYKSAFIDTFSCIHIGRKTWEREDDSKLNAYKLNRTRQFSINDKLDINIIEHNDNEVWKKTKINANKTLPHYNIINSNVKELNKLAKHMFLGNNFQYRRDILNNIWGQFNKITSFSNEYCVMLSDHINLENFNNNLNDLMENLDQDNHLIFLNDDKSAYVISQKGSDIIKNNIDRFVNINKMNDIFDLFSPDELTVKKLNILPNQVEIKFSNPINIDNYEFYSNMDSHGNDITYIGGKSVEELKVIADKMKNCIGFNSLGWFKHAILEESEFKYLHTQESDIFHGIYVKKN